MKYGKNFLNIKLADKVKFKLFQRHTLDPILYWPLSDKGNNLEYRETTRRQVRNNIIKKQSY